MALDNILLKILACPKWTDDLTLTPNEDFLIRQPCKLKYEIKEDIPIMLIEETIKLD